jgi:hypothetical protein
MATPVADNYTAANGSPLYCGRANPTAATSVTVDDYLNYRVFQRVGTSKAITISGTYAGSPAALEWRVVDHTTGSPMSTWATLVSSPTGGTFSASATVPQGGWYKMQVRCSTNKNVIGSSSNKLGVGVVIAMVGQSNMENRRGTGSKRPLGDKRAVYFRDTLVWDRIGNINDSGPVNTESGDAGYGSPTINADSNGDGFTYYANLISQGLNLPVCLFEFANSGASITTWISGQSHWTNFVTRSGLAGGDFELALWHQGESDAHTMSKATYKSNLATLHTQFKTLTGRTNSNFKLAIIGLGIGSYASSTEGEFGKIRTAHLEYTQENAGCYYSTSAHDTYTGDGVHLGADSFNKISRRDAKSALYYIGNIGAPASGPKATSATRSDAVITVNLAHTGGSTLTDGTGGSGTALTGFEVFDNGVAATISSAIIGSSNTLTITLASVPTGPVTIQYAMMNNPHSANATTAPTLSTIVYDNALYYNSTIGCPLQPFAAMSVT